MGYSALVADTVVEGASDPATLRAWVHRQLHVTLAIDLRALAMMRMALGWLIAWDMMARWGDATALYSDAGFWSRARAGKPFLLFRFYDLSGDPSWAQLGLGITAGLALMFAAGLLTRPVTALLWAMVTALHLRQGWVIQGGDDLLRNFLFFALFLPLGRRWSLDARWRHRGMPPRRVAGLAAVVFYVQLFLLYFLAGAMKAHHVHWWQGLGIHYALSADHFVTPLGRSIHGYSTLLRGVGFGTLLLELVVPFALFLGPPSARLRGALIAAFVSLHVGIALTLEIGLFSFVCIALWLFTLPTPWLDCLEARLGGRPEGPTLAASPKWVGYVSAAFMVALVLTQTARNTVPSGPVRNALMWPMGKLRLQDKWSLFSGRRTHTGWAAAPAITPDGREVDLLRGGAPLSWARPEDQLALYPNQRWRKLWVTMRKERAHRAAEAYVAWLCTTGPYKRVSYVYVRHAIHPPDRPMDQWFDREERVPITAQDCPTR